MTYDAIATSVQDAVRAELYTFELPGVTYRLTDFDEDVTFDGVTYTAAPVARGPVPLVPLGKIRDVTVSLDLNSALARALRTNGIPPREIVVTIRAIHIGDTGSRFVWRGFVALASTDEQYTRLTVPNRVDEALDCMIPAVAAQRDCPHMLYDAGCGVDASTGGFILTPTVSSVDGTELVISSISSKPDQWARYGKVVRASDGEERSILAQVGTTLTLDVPFRELEVGDVLSVYAGCDHTIEACASKFSNVLNFGGDPEMPTGNPAAPTGYGVATQV